MYINIMKYMIFFFMKQTGTIMTKYMHLTDAILVGDFNAGCNYIVQGEYEMIRLYTDQRFHWLISDHADTTTKTTSCPYDRSVNLLSTFAVTRLIVILGIISN